MTTNKKALAIVTIWAVVIVSIAAARAPRVFSYASTALTCHYSQTVSVHQDDGRTTNGTLVTVLSVGNWTSVWHRWGIYNFPHLGLRDGRPDVKYVLVNGQRYNASGVEWGRRLIGYGVRLNQSEEAVLPPSC